MKISFVIPAFNEENYLKDCLESIFHEAEGKNYDFEIIVVNNASTDRTRKIAKSFKNVKVVDEPQKGLVHARKTGYLASKGDLIANVDADTRLTKGWIDKVIFEFKNHNLTGLSGPFIYYDLQKKYQPMVRFFYYYAFSLYLFNRYILNRGSMLQGGNFVIRRSALKKIGGFDDKHFSFYGEDADIAMRLHSTGSVKWTFSFPMYSSGRRLAGEGPFTLSSRYTINYIWVSLFGKPFTHKVIDIRFKGIKGKYLAMRPRDVRGEYFSTFFVLILLVFLPFVAPIMIACFLYSLSTKS
jgi:glycosyltransferase involved in cell wall biosynthesis